MPTLDPSGYTARDLNDVLGDLRSAARLQFGDDINVSASGKAGGLLGVFAEAIADVEKATQAIYDAFDRDNAEGAQLDNLAGIIGLLRLPALQSTVLVDLGGTGGVPVPVGSLVANNGGERFATLDSAVVGDTGVRCRAVEFGAVDVSPSAVDTIITSITGWNTVTNPAVGASGRDRETDAEFRARMAVAPSVVGACTVEAIRADLQAALPTALGVLVVENTTETVDANGLPAKSFRAILYPNTLDRGAIAATLWAAKPAGIYVDGTEVEPITDSMGFDHDMRWDWAADYYVEVIVDLSGAALDPDYPGDAAVVAVVQDAIDALGIGAAVRAWALVCEVVENVLGINDIVVTYRQKGVGSYVGTPLQPPFDEKPLIELSGDITVVT